LPALSLLFNRCNRCLGFLEHLKTFSLKLILRDLTILMSFSAHFGIAQLFVSAILLFLIVPPEDSPLPSF
jgi:hypothetical protein